MVRQSSSGICSYCHKSYAKSAMARHLKACKERRDVDESEAISSDEGKVSKGNAKIAIFHLQVEGLDSPMYWTHIEIPANATLEDLDRFLRAFWLECCGHFSSFEIAGETYISEIMEPGDRSMDIALKKVIAPGMKFEYIYDFGTSTELLIKVISVRQGQAQGKEVRIMARNAPPDIRCQSCDKPAIAVCCQCVYEGTGWVCDDCAKKHKCGEDMLLPVVNSPRVGMCDYTGGNYD